MELGTTQWGLEGCGVPGVHVATSQGGTDPAPRKKAAASQSVWETEKA